MTSTHQLVCVSLITRRSSSAAFCCVASTYFCLVNTSARPQPRSYCCSPPGTFARLYVLREVSWTASSAALTSGLEPRLHGIVYPWQQFHGVLSGGSVLPRPSYARQGPPASSSYPTGSCLSSFHQQELMPLCFLLAGVV